MWLTLLAAIGCLPLLCAAAHYHAGPEDYRVILQRLQPGDRLTLAPGEYRRGLPVHDLDASADRPTLIEGPPHGPPAVFRARPGANTVSLVNVSHLRIRHLELDGRHLSVDGVKAEGHSRHAHFVTLEQLYIHDHDASQQNVGISTKCPAYGWTVRANRIERVGTGMYFGDSDGTDPFVAGVVEYNVVSASIGYNLQIKHQLPRPDMGAMPRDGQATLIRHNVFSKAGGGSTGPLARPNLLVGHQPVTGWGSGDRYLIYGNFFYENPDESLFQGEGNIALYSNLFVTTGPDAIRIQSHNAAPKEVRILFNTVLAAANGITVDAPPNNRAAQVAAANAVFAARPIEGVTQARNLLGGYHDAARYLLNPFAPLGQMDLAPRRRGDETGDLPGRQLAGLADADRDFAGRYRQAGTPGAYDLPGQASAWLPVLDFKPLADGRAP